MTFKDVAFKNFMVNLKRYLSYFLCSGFSIMIFFMYTTLLFNKSIKMDNDDDLFKLIFYIALTGIALFSVFFINYAHTAFINSRYKEFGVYMTLGMTSKDIGRIILIENFLIIATSLVAGLVTGLVFSRLFQMVAASLLDIKNISYSIHAESFILTVGVFAVIFAVVLLKSSRTASKFQIGELLKKSKQNETALRGRMVPGILGFIVLAVSIATFFIISSQEKFNSNIAVIIPIILLIFAGLYLTVSYLGVTLLSLIKRNKKGYYKRLLVVTEITHKFNQNKKILFILSVLSSMIVFFVASPISQYNLSERIADMTSVNDVEFASVYGINQIDDAKIDAILKSENEKCTGNYKVEFLALTLKPEQGTSKPEIKPVIGETYYNKLTNSAVHLRDGEAFNAITAWQPGDTGIASGSDMTFESGGTFHVIGSQKASWVSSSFPSASGIVLSDRDYAKFKAQTPDSIGTYHIFKFENWKQTAGVISDLTIELNKANTSVSAKQEDLVKLLSVNSRLDVFNGLKKGYSMFVFIMLIMGILFFISAGSVLFFKQYSEIEDARRQYQKLYKIGVTKREAANVITKELLVTFFSPLLFGGIIGYAFIYFSTNLFGGHDIIQEFMLNATYVFAAYIVFQTFFFIAARKKFIREVLIGF